MAFSHNTPISRITSRVSVTVWMMAALALTQGSLAQNIAVMQVSPAAHTITAPTSSDISILFDVPVDPATITERSFWAFGRWSGKVVGEFAFSNGNRVVTLSPDYPLSAGESVMVILSHDIASAAGDPLRSAGFSYQFWAASVSATEGFTKVQELTTRTNPGESSRAYGGIATDLNGDRFCDITIVNEDTADLRVFMSKGDFTSEFEPFIQPGFDVNDRASPSEPTDFNHDDIPDICVANLNSATVSVLMGNGDGTFAPQIEYQVAGTPRGIAVLDVNGDGHIDIVNTNFVGNNLSILVNDGTGQFLPAQFFNTTALGEWALAAADMNDDGILDLVVSARNSRTLHVLQGNGDETFTEVSSRDVDGLCWQLNLGDLNGDGFEDVAAVSAFANKGLICLGDGQGNLGPPTEYPVDPFPLASDIGDIDGDGDLDWLTSSFSGDWFYFKNDGDGTFTFERKFTASAAASCALLFDADRDGDLDIALIDELADTLQIYRNGPPVPRFALEITGSCPGPMAVTLTGGEPSTLVAILIANMPGTFVIPKNRPCAGTILGLNATVKRIAFVRLDANGEAVLNANARNSVCGKFLQAINLSGCATSNVVEIK